jgi:hypothetical protein
MTVVVVWVTWPGVVTNVCAAACDAAPAPISAAIAGTAR